MPERSYHLLLQISLLILSFASLKYLRKNIKLCVKKTPRILSGITLNKIRLAFLLNL